MTVKAWLNDFNTTSFRIFVSIILAVVQIVALNLAMWLGWSPTPGQKWVLMGIGGGILTMMGFDVLQFWSKRTTDVGYATAKTSPVTVEAPSTVAITPTKNQPQEPRIVPGDADVENKP